MYINFIVLYESDVFTDNSLDSDFLQRVNLLSKDILQSRRPGLKVSFNNLLEGHRISVSHIVFAEMSIIKYKKRLKKNISNDRLISYSSTINDLHNKVDKVTKSLSVPVYFDFVPNYR